jgi:hypothetical protein
MCGIPNIRDASKQQKQCDGAFCIAYKHPTRISPYLNVVPSRYTGRYRICWTLDNVSKLHNTKNRSWTTHPVHAGGPTPTSYRPTERITVQLTKWRLITSARNKHVCWNKRKSNATVPLYTVWLKMAWNTTWSLGQGALLHVPRPSITCLLTTTSPGILTRPHRLQRNIQLCVNMLGVSSTLSFVSLVFTCFNYS